MQPLTGPEHAELSLLSALLLEPALLDEQASMLVPEDFTGQRSIIFAGIQKAHSEGLPLDLPVLRATISPAVPDDVIMVLPDYTATTVNVAHHIEMVRAESLRRSIAEAGQQIVRMAADPEVASDDILDNAETIILDIGKNRDKKSSGPIHARDLVLPALDAIEQAANRGQSGQVTGVATGFDELDKMTGGFQGGELIVIAARPSMGKTASAMNMAEYAAETQGINVLVFSLEMTGRALIERMIASRAGVDSKQIRLGWVSVADHHRMQTAAGEIEKMGLYIDDSGAMRPSEIKARARRLHAKAGLGLVIVDYLQLVRPDGRRDRKDLEIADASMALKSLAKELSVPVIALSQLNRGPEQRDPDKRRPMMADIRESGAVEQDADVILFLYREHVYKKEAPADEAEIIIGKQRNGPTGIVPLGWNGKLARFTQAPRRSERTYEDPDVI